MTGLKYTMAAIPGGNTRRTYGTAFWDGAAWFANVGGNLLTCRWLDPIQPVQGGNLVVDITTDERGQSTALVVGAYSDRPRPSTGTILTMTPDVVIAGAFGGSVIAARIVGTYAIGDNVQLIWDSSRPTVISLAPSVVLPPTANTPKKPDGGDITGTLRTPATRADTFGPGGWGQSVASERRNVVNNPRASTGLTGFQAGSGTLSRITSGGPPSSATFARTTTTSAVASVDVRSTGVGLNLVTPGKVYYLYGQSRGSVAGNVRLFVQWYDAAGAQLSTVSTAGTNNTANVWEPYTYVTPAAPATAVRAQIIFRLTATLASGATFDTTSVMLSDAPGAYFDGDTADTLGTSTATGRAWVGTAHASPSTETIAAFGGGGWSGGEDVYTGATLAGAWFYGVGNTMLAGKTIKEVRFRFPQRLGVGDTGTATVHLYAHTSSNRPVGDVTRTVGPFDVSVAQNAPPQWVTLPTTFHADLLAGGGISISGDPYIGFRGRLKDPDSGKLEIEWMN